MESGVKGQSLLETEVISTQTEHKVTRVWMSVIEKKQGLRIEPGGAPIMC